MFIIIAVFLGLGTVSFFWVSTLKQQLLYKKWAESNRIKNKNRVLTEGQSGPYRSNIKIVTAYEKPKSVFVRAICSHKIKLRDCVGWTWPLEDCPTYYVFDSVCVKCGERNPRYLSKGKRRALSFEFIHDAEKYYSKNRGSNTEPRNGKMRIAGKR